MAYGAEEEETSNVPTVRLGDFVLAQGRHPGVQDIFILAGLTGALDAGAIAYIVFEFWPRGMDLMAISWLA